MSEHEHRFTREEIKATLKDHDLNDEEKEQVMDQLEQLADILFDIWLKQRNNATTKEMGIEENPNNSS